MIRFILRAVSAFLALWIPSFTLALVLPFDAYWSVAAWVMLVGAVLFFYTGAITVYQVELARSRLWMVTVAVLLCLAPACGSFAAEWAKLKQTRQPTPPAVEQPARPMLDSVAPTSIRSV